MYFSRWRIIAVIAAIVLGMLVALPNVMSRDTLAKLPGWVPTRQVNLGLDLRGGAYLLLQIDTDTLNKERLETALDSARGAGSPPPPAAAPHEGMVGEPAEPLGTDPRPGNVGHAAGVPCQRHGLLASRRVPQPDAVLSAGRVEVGVAGRRC